MSSVVVFVEALDGQTHRLPWRILSIRTTFVSDRSTSRVHGGGSLDGGIDGARTGMLDAQSFRVKVLARFFGFRPFRSLNDDDDAFQRDDDNGHKARMPVRAAAFVLSLITHPSLVSYIFSTRQTHT